MAKQWEEGGRRSIWNSLFDASEFSACNENDADLQGVSMLLKKMFGVFEKLKARCEEAESAQQRPCHRCKSLEKVVTDYKAKLRQTESRMKSIAQILNMGGGLSQDVNASPGKQKSMAKALTQILFNDEMEISEDESEPEGRGTKRKRCSPTTLAKVNAIAQKRSPVKVNVIPQKRSPAKVDVTPQKRSPAKVIGTSQKRSPGKESPKRGRVIAPESLPAVRNVVERKVVVLETLCSQMAAPVDVVFLSDTDDSYVAPVTPTRQRPSPQRKSSPVIRSKASRLKLANRAAESNRPTPRDDGSCSFTSSPPLSAKKSPFTPKLRVTKDKTNLGSPSDILDGLVSTPDLYGRDKMAASSGEKTPDVIFRTPHVDDRERTNLVAVSKNTTPSDFVQTLVSTPESCGVGDETFMSPSLLHGMNLLQTPAAGVGDETFMSPSLLHGMNLLQTPAARPHRPHSKVASGPSTSKTGPEATSSDFGRVKSTGNAKVDNILDIICDTTERTTGDATDCPKPSTSKRNEENSPDSCVPRKQADYWKLKPAPASKEPLSFGKGQKLKQTRIAFGVHPERTDVCTLEEFNGGVRQSQAERDQFALREFNGGLRPGQTSTMLSTEATPDCSEEAAFERAILDSLKDTNTQFVPDQDDDEVDFVSPSPDLSLSKRFVSSQRAKQSTSDAVDLKENEATPPDTEALLDEMAEPSLPRRNLDRLIRDFDRVPKRHEDVPAYKYQRDAVRKRDERMKMEGWDCAACKNYYAGRVNSSAERKELMNKCSKHRDNYKRNDTPPGYWNPEFPSTPELRARNLDITQKPVKFRTRKRLTTRP